MECEYESDKLDLKEHVPGDLLDLPVELGRRLVDPLQWVHVRVEHLANLHHRVRVVLMAPENML